MAVETMELNPEALPDQDIWVYLTVRSTEGEALDVAGKSAGEGAAVIQWPWTQNSSSQQWQPQRVGPSYEYFKLVVRHSGKFLTVVDASTDDGAAVVQESWNGGDNQLWKYTPLTTGGLMVTAKHSGKALQVVNGSDGNGAAIIQNAPDTGNPAQSWHSWYLRQE
ncbi:MAG TPA: RICIN domain-containing protein [Streptosporangiaceae bacterium]|nr:RICIN domain-containing protein [Streptosporangiaceae bacterium]